MSLAETPAQVARADMVALRAREIHLVAVGGGRLPTVDPGAHVTVRTPAGQSRSYSITAVTHEGGYVICVDRDDTGRGGSMSLHADLSPGDHVLISEPRNTFPLVEAPSYLMIAGGIGITPLRAMFLDVRDRADARLLYLARSRDEAAYARDLEGIEGVTIHYSSRSGRFDLWSILSDPDDHTHVYCCASQPLMDAVRMLTMHWRPSRIHFEDFAGVSASQLGDSEFDAVWEPTGERVRVAARESLLDALRRRAIRMDSSCESGTCGTCVLRLASGEAEHRDLVLAEHERPTRIISCVSRAASDEITVAPVAPVARVARPPRVATFSRDTPTNP